MQLCPWGCRFIGEVTSRILGWCTGHRSPVICRDPHLPHVYSRQISNIFQCQGNIKGITSLGCFLLLQEGAISTGNLQATHSTKARLHAHPQFSWGGRQFLKEKVGSLHPLQKPKPWSWTLSWLHHCLFTLKEGGARQ